ncbi:toxic anion resistance protein [Magnetovirga frankeli]|uniref:toxic anion resistance protein n=1 Tax=Magnetovirga frankeli TaxID=947516 RepID=UPI001293602D|nr:toxic anion resistance protein [gamma proteobacterium SS-5]
MAEETASQLVFVDKEALKKDLKLADPLEIGVASGADPKLEEQAEDVVARITQIDLNDSQQQEGAKAAIEAMGMDLQREAARRSAMLKQPLSKLMQDSEEGGQVATSLIDLKTEVEELDPTHLDLEAGWFSRLLGYIPGVGTPLKRYFSRYESASTTIDAIIKSLEAGREQLKRDNITLADDQAAMRALTHKLEKSIQLARLIDARLQNALDNQILQDDPQHKFISEELLFPLRQRIQDLQQQLLVNQQGYLTIEMVIRNNKELMRGVNRALNTTVSALQVAVTLALALANQRIVLEKVQAINSTTENLITGTAKRLKTQGAEIQKQAASTQLDIGKLREAFADIHGALDDLTRYRQEALPKMAANIMEMGRMAEESEQHIRQVEHADKARSDFPLEIVD